MVVQDFDKNMKLLFFSLATFGIFLTSSVSAQTSDPCATGGQGTCEIPVSLACPDGREYLGASTTCVNYGGSSGRICCKTVDSSMNTCTSNCGTDGTCSCVASASCTSPKTTVSAGNSYCSAQTAGNICCKTLNSSSGTTTTSGTTEAKCKDGFEEYAGVCFPTNTGLSKLGIIDIAVNLMKWMLYLFGFLAIISFVVSGIQYLAASGNASMIETAKRNMTYSIVGVIVALAGLVIITAIDALLKGTAWGG